MFGCPLYNKDFGYIYLDLTREVEEGNSMTLSDIIVPEKNYRWRVRLYEDEIVDVDTGSVNINSVYGTTYIGSGNIVGTTKQVTSALSSARINRVMSGFSMMPRSRRHGSSLSI